MELEGQQEPQEPQQPEAPQQPQIDPRQAVEIAAQQFGMTPDQLEGAMRLQDENQRVYEENRRRARDLELREAQIEALSRERQRYVQPEPQYEINPELRPLYDKMAAWERRQEEKDRREEAASRAAEDAQRTAVEWQSHFESLMRGVPTQSRIEFDQFINSGMRQLWPEGPPPSISPAMAVERTARYLGIQSNGIQPTPGYMPRSNPYRDPRAQFIVPSATNAPTVSAPSQGPDSTTQRPGETPEQYFQRRIQAMKDAGYNSPSVPDGTKVSFG